MRNIFSITILILSLLVLSSLCFAEDNLWEKEFVLALENGKADNTGQTGGLGYTPAEDTVLENAIKQAMDLNAPPGELVKIALDLGYDPYSVIKKVFGHAGKEYLNPIFAYALERGIDIEIVTKAATDAASPLGEPIYSDAEIAQFLSTREIGLGYTANPLTIPSIAPPPPLKFVSAQSPGV